MSSVSTPADPMCSLYFVKIEAALQEREVMPHLLRSLYKRIFSTCVSHLGNSFHAPTDHPNIRCRLPLRATLLAPGTPVTRPQRRCPNLFPT